MDLKQLECFLAVARELHFGRAAEKLNVSQSSVSEAVKALEHALGGLLFDRTSRRVALTPLGETLRKGAAPALIQLKASIEDCKQQAAGKPRLLKIGFLGGGFYELHQPFVTEAKAAHPEIELEFVELTYVTHFAAVSDGTVDAAFCRLPLGADGLRHGPVIMRDQRLLCVPQDHPLATTGLVDPELLAQERLVRMVPGSVNQEWQDYHFPRHTPQGKPIGEGPVIRTIREAIAAVGTRQALLMLTKRAASYYATPQIAFVEIDLPAMPSALVWRADDRRPILQELDALLLRIGRRYGIAPA
ncbi:LysR family transcriptional regulator [Cupriavidus basilensis]|uniref:LysR family transcriptional regulator n=1 Tax=Cupriavidus basilensis TaxID=68895 RepID=A0A643G026_9BURK|nr:LysR family transcriptional regulator [Cupriavidus basilensis]QOT78043.1 LysR family transcriptional regulator [Cupriavidus basilensis]